jgi:hypothetical protein
MKFFINLKRKYALIALLNSQKSLLFPTDVYVFRKFPGNYKDNSMDGVAPRVAKPCFAGCERVFKISMDGKFWIIV